ncbi:MAG: response regulator [candidate division WOR-3 bacterium]
MKEILIVDDFRPTLDSIGDYLSRKFKGEMRIHLAENGREAIEILEKKEIDLVVTDIAMPIMDGLELLAYMSKKYSEIPVIVMTSFGTPQIEENLKKFKAFLYIEKPFDINSLEEKILEGLKGETEGHIRGFSLPSFLQLIALESKTCTLKIEYEGKKGFLYFINGSLIDAKTGTNSGLEAAIELLSLEKAEIEIDGKCKKTERVIDAPLHYLLLESARIKDEENRKKKSVEDLEKEIKIEVEKELYTLLDLNFNLLLNNDTEGTFL